MYSRNVSMFMHRDLPHYFLELRAACLWTFFNLFNRAFMNWHLGYFQYLELQIMLQLIN